MNMQKIANDLEELYGNFELRLGFLRGTEEERRHNEAMRIHLLRARIEVEKCKWLETIANRMPDKPVQAWKDSDPSY